MCMWFMGVVIFFIAPINNIYRMVTNMDDRGQRINKITVNVDKKYGEVRIIFYRTNTKLGEISDEDLDLPSFDSAGVSLNAYKEYCKDFVIEFIDQGGIPGFYYEPKSDGKSVKYDPSNFRNGIKEYIANVIGDKYEYSFPLTEQVNITEQYKDKYIKNANGIFNVNLTQYDITISVLGEIKSGQLCRPRAMEYNGDRMAFNITNINRIVKSS